MFLDMLAHKQLDPKPLLSWATPLEDVQKAIDSGYATEMVLMLLVVVVIPRNRRSPAIPDSIAAR